MVSCVASVTKRSKALANLRVKSPARQRPEIYGPENPAFGEIRRQRTKKKDYYQTPNCVIFKSPSYNADANKSFAFFSFFDFLLSFLEATIGDLIISQIMTTKNGRRVLFQLASKH